MAFLDIKKAFDSVNRRKVIERMEHLGVHGNTLSWIRCFLRERMAQVFVNEVAGETIEWKYGVPQGSVLSPLLFILFIDPMVSGLKCKSSLFDVSLWSSHDHIGTIAQDMNADLFLISSWGRNNDLKSGLKKCGSKRRGISRISQISEWKVRSWSKCTSSSTWDSYSMRDSHSKLI